MFVTLRHKRNVLPDIVFQQIKRTRPNGKRLFMEVQRRKSRTFFLFHGISQLLPFQTANDVIQIVGGFTNQKIKNFLCGVCKLGIRKIKIVGQERGQLLLRPAFVIYANVHQTVQAESLRFWRPFLAVAADVFWYVLTALVFRRLRPRRFAALYRRLELCACNGVVVGVALLANYRFRVNAPELILLCVGATVSFWLLSLLLTEGMRRMKEPEMPEAFRGLPAQLLYLGLLALALYGFSAPVSFL